MHSCDHTYLVRVGMRAAGPPTSTTGTWTAPSVLMRFVPGFIDGGVVMANRSRATTHGIGHLSLPRHKGRIDNCAV